ncbi:hypothetical protein Pyrfu_0496 [Pyrolobus fumarii 1A]|uniref:DUF3800 domain-containing protein n=1 Tax=Pyrolobus fumarii (strain DSM 11204 / 1A) TaxID=694429 RepID=G0EGJ3_PYRF1|nr:hypothetical protein [Pyrolobus fumarii]AEM38367.1 hypothetical protein Pyrfu_0496 [Pyrolobus fumarii 1A]
MKAVKVACFADEGGSFTPCSSVCVALVCFEKDASLDATPGGLYERLAGLLGWRRGELKWRSVKKAARRRGLDVSGVLGAILEASLCYSVVRGHVGSSSETGLVKGELLLEAVSRVSGCMRGYSVSLVVDAHLAGSGTVRRAGRVLGAGYTRIGDSRVYRGVQLADLLAGACSEGLLDPGWGCRVAPTSRG